jgi:hypothetical protein
MNEKGQDVMENHIGKLFPPGFEWRTFDPVRRILAVTGDSLLDEGVTGLLSSKGNLVVQIAGSGDEEALLRDVVQMHPDIIVLFNSEPASQERLVALLDNIPSLKYSQIMIVTLDSKKFHLYSGNCWSMVACEEFFSLIHGTKASVSI